MTQLSHPSVTRASGGAILLVTLLLLLLMTILGTAVVDSGSLQSQMSRNSLESQTLYRITRNEIQGQYVALENSAYRRRIDNAAPTPATSSNHGVPPIRTLRLTASDMTTANPDQRYRRSGLIALLDDSVEPLSGYSLNRFRVRRYEVTIVTHLRGTALQSSQTEGIVCITPPTPRR